MRTITTVKTVYLFSELSDRAKENAISNCSDCNTFFEWWDTTYDDANDVGIKITGFDIDRGAYCNAEFMASAEETAHKIIDNHGEVCETYKTAAQYLKESDELIDTAAKTEDGEFEDESHLDGLLDELDGEFLKSISEDYRIILQNEYEYLTSREAIIETIEANGCEFLEDGRRA